MNNEIENAKKSIGENKNTVHDLIEKYSKLIDEYNSKVNTTQSIIQRCNGCAFGTNIEKPIIISDGVRSLLFCNKLDAYVFGDKIACQDWKMGENLKSKINKTNEDSKNKIEDEKIYGLGKNPIPKISEEWADIIRKVYFGDKL